MLTTACFATAVAAYLAAGVLLARGRRHSRRGRGTAGLLFLAAVGGSWLWALAGLLVLGGPFATDPPAAAALAALGLADGLRAGLWLWVAHAVLDLVRAGAVEVAARDRPLLWGGGILVAVKLLAALAAAVAPAAAAVAATATELERVAGLGLGVLGLIIVENVYKASEDGGTRWAVKHLLVGLGGLFAFDLFRYADALLLQRFSAVTLAAQPLVAALAAPLLVVAAARIRNFSIDIHVARRFVLQTTALVASGAYLLAVAAAGFLTRRLGLPWNPAFQLAFLFGALLLLAALLSSGQVRARGRRLVERSFFSFAYDYREAWLGFVATMAGDDGRQPRPLHERAIRAVAEPLDCSAGLLYLPGRDGGHRCAAQWNWLQAAAAPPPPPGLLRALDGDGGPARDLRRPAAGAPGTEAWPGQPDGSWILLALRTRGRRVGLLLLGKPRVSRELTWEDHDLLGVLAAQVAGYIAEEQTITELAEARRFERVSKRFSFVAHDLKNVVSQLSLLLQQAERHGDKPEFLRDTLLTVGESVETMRTMLLRLREEREEAEAGVGPGRPPVDLAALLAGVAERERRAGRALAFEATVRSAPVEAEPDALAAVVGNLVDNAYDAGGRAVTLSLAVRGDDGDRGPGGSGGGRREAVVEVRDDGSGMTRAFVDERLFRPFASTKATGFGIGLYQCREQAERWGGWLEVESEPGVGTVVRVRLPLATSGTAERRREGPDGPGASPAAPPLLHAVG